MTLPEDDATLCVDLILNALSKRARREVEKIMVQNFEPRSEFLRKYLETGRAQGREEATADAILRVLEARGLRVSRTAQGRIRNCRDLAKLQLWLTRAATVERATKLFD